jgi:endonuclease YncB( thermonuclease family)
MRPPATVALLGAALLFSTTFAAVAAPAGVLSGIAVAKDGDGVLFGQVEIRLQGIAAPEWNKRKRDPGGEASVKNLHTLINGRPLRCELDGTTTGPKSRYRPAGICFLEDGRDIGMVQVLGGFARDCPRNSNGRYAAAEQRARAAGHDLSAIYALPGYCN